jgi:hypothetical protein
MHRDKIQSEWLLFTLSSHPSHLVQVWVRLDLVRKVVGPSFKWHLRDMRFQESFPAHHDPVLALVSLATGSRGCCSRAHPDVAASFGQVCDAAAPGSALAGEVVPIED